MRAGTAFLLISGCCSRWTAGVDAPLSPRLTCDDILSPGMVHEVTPRSFQVRVGPSHSTSAVGPFVTVSVEHTFRASLVEATVEQYERMRGGNPLHAPSCAAEQELLTGSRRPAACLSWYDAVAFANSASDLCGLQRAYTLQADIVVWNKAANGFRLPTELEWESMAGAGLERPWGAAVSEASSLCVYANLKDQTLVARGAAQGGVPCTDGWAGTSPVGSKAPTGTVYDAIGNVAEWVWTPTVERSEFPSLDRLSEADSLPASLGGVVKGGAWKLGEEQARTESRVTLERDARESWIGVRLVAGPYEEVQIVGERRHEE